MKKNRGFTLVEIIASIVILSMTSVMVLAVFSPGYKQIVKQKNLYKAKEIQKNKMEQEIFNAIKKSERFNESATPPPGSEPDTWYKNSGGNKILGVDEIKGYTLISKDGSLTTFVSNGYKKVKLPSVSNVKISLKLKEDEKKDFRYLYQDDVLTYTLSGVGVRSTGLSIPYGVHGSFLKSKKDENGNFLYKPVTGEEFIEYNPVFRGSYYLLTTKLTLMDYINPNDTTKIKQDEGPPTKTVEYEYTLRKEDFPQYEDRDFKLGCVPLGMNAYIGNETESENAVRMIGLPRPNATTDKLAAHYDASLIIEKSGDKYMEPAPSSIAKWEDVRKYTEIDPSVNKPIQFKNMKLEYTDYGKMVSVPKTSIFDQLQTFFTHTANGRTIYLRWNSTIPDDSGASDGQWVIASMGNIAGNAENSFRLYADHTATAKYPNGRLVLEKIGKTKAQKIGETARQDAYRKERYAMPLQKPYCVLTKDENHPRNGFEIVRIDTVKYSSASGTRYILKVRLLKAEAGTFKLSAQGEFTFTDSELIGVHSSGWTDLNPLEVGVSQITSVTFDGAIASESFNMGGVAGTDTSGKVYLSDIVLYDTNPAELDATDATNLWKDVSAYLFRKYLTEEELKKCYPTVYP